ncbi:DUF1684 domain-containing protein [Dyadobacter sp. 3J3]|uniref:DUF1684 domain-containing protein n=1 Tax=Dyadobacter sp. 3J3 TaxID=2606600 RepID=UPI001356FDF4|nr:DUF1684 domain-containing protein [Dyadobacter sp. 3J3]
MFKNKVIRWSTLAMLVAILAYFFIENFSSGNAEADKDDLIAANPQQYIEKITQERVSKDDQFRTTKDSPIQDKDNFHGLHYFDIDPSYRVKAYISPYDKKDVELKVPYTDGSTTTYEKMGYANFSINGVAQKLLLLKNEAVISVLFKDATSGKETYGGGRYLDYPVSKIKGDSLVLDFNTAYNPYCVYAPTYACPVPPKENTLSVAIRAGEQGNH